MKALVHLQNQFHLVVAPTAHMPVTCYLNACKELVYSTPLCWSVCLFNSGLWGWYEGFTCFRKLQLMNLFRSPCLGRQAVQTQQPAPGRNIGHSAKASFTQRPNWSWLITFLQWGRSQILPVPTHCAKWEFACGTVCIIIEHFVSIILLLVHSQLPKISSVISQLAVAEEGTCRLQQWLYCHLIVCPHQLFHLLFVILNSVNHLCDYPIHTISQSQQFQSQILLGMLRCWRTASMIAVPLFLQNQGHGICSAGLSKLPATHWTTGSRNAWLPRDSDVSLLDF